VIIASDKVTLGHNSTVIQRDITLGTDWINKNNPNFN